MSVAMAMFIAFMAGLVLLYFAGKLMTLPRRLILRLVSNALLGGALLWGFNALGTLIGLEITINPFTALMAGFLGLPGVAALAVITWFWL